jgi:hypothetical protein
MFQVFSVMRQLKELLWYLSEARAALPAGALRAEVDQVHARTLALVGTPAADLARLDVAAHRAHVGPVLAEVSASLRAGVPGRGRDRVGADLTGARLRGADLRGVSLRGAYLLGADLRGADLTRTDLLGATSAAPTSAAPAWPTACSSPSPSSAPPPGTAPRPSRSG